MKPLPTDPAGRRGREPGHRPRAEAAVLGLAALLVAWPGSELSAQAVETTDASSASEAATFLLVPLGARSVGFGGAFAGASGDVEGAMWNPAALAEIDEWAVHYHGANDFGTATHAIGGVVRWRSARVGLSLLAVDLGTIEGRDAGNNPIGTIGVSNTLAILTVAHPISSIFEVGGSYKLVRLGGSCRGCSGLAPDATGHAFDLAASAVPPGLDGVRLGFVASNLGGGISLRSDGPSDPLPSRIRLGGEMELLRPGPEGEVEVRARADLQQTFSEFDDLDLFAGAEVGYRAIAFLRAGYAATGAGRTGPTLGVGVRHLGFHLDVGRSFDDFAGFDSDSPFQVSLSYRR